MLAVACNIAKAPCARAEDKTWQLEQKPFCLCLSSVCDHSLKSALQLQICQLARLSQSIVCTAYPQDDPKRSLQCTKGSLGPDCI